LLANERIGLLHTDLTKLISLEWKPYAAKFVVRHPVTVQDKKYHSLHRLLRAIDHNTLLSKLPVEAQASADETFIGPAELLERFNQYPAFVVNTYTMLAGCDIAI
jgi:DNA polymerase III alpha subunit